MAMHHGTLGQSAPAAGVSNDIYTVPAATEAVLSTINVCNRDSNGTTFRVAVRPNAAAIANQHYICFDVPIAANSSIPITIGATVDAADVVTVQSASGLVSFSVFGVEFS